MKKNYAFVEFRLKFPWIKTVWGELLCRFNKHDWSVVGGDSDGNEWEWCSRCDLQRDALRKEQLNQLKERME